MEMDALTSDLAVLRELGKRLKRHRIDRNLTQAMLANEAGVSKSTVERIEGGGSTQLNNFVRVLRILGLLDNIDLLVPKPAPSPMEQMRLQGKRRRRASSAHERKPDEPWTWGKDR
jgi:putative transcriptional regulator